MWTRHLSVWQSYSLTSQMRCRYMQRSTVTSEHNREGIVNPWLLLNCPSLTTECICENPSGLSLHWCSKAILQQSCLMQKKSCFCQALILGMGNLWRFLSPAPAEILNSRSSASGRTIQSPPCLLAWCSDPDPAAADLICACGFLEMAIRTSCII